MKKRYVDLHQLGRDVARDIEDGPTPEENVTLMLVEAVGELAGLYRLVRGWSVNLNVVDPERRLAEQLGLLATLVYAAADLCGLQLRELHEYEPALGEDQGRAIINLTTTISWFADHTDGYRSASDLDSIVECTLECAFAFGVDLQAEWQLLAAEYAEDSL